jgi:hypothetical protein
VGLGVATVRVEIRSERRARAKVRVLRERPIMVRNWRCQPKDSFCEMLVSIGL